MLPKYHILLGFLFTILLKLATDLDNVALGIIFLSTFLIDVDHYLIYVLRKKDFDFDNAYDWFIELEKKDKKLKFLYVFHTLEFFIMILILGLYFDFFNYVLIGFLFHLSFDIVKAIAIKRWNRYSSIIYFIIKHRKNL